MKKNNDTWKVDPESPVFNFFLEFIVYIFVAVVVFILGLAASMLFNDFTHLGRAGALITLIAISMAYRDFYLDLKSMSIDETIKFLGNEKLFQLWAVSFVHKKKKELEQLKPGFNEADAIEFINSLKANGNSELDKDTFMTSWLTEMFDIWSRKLRKWEFTMLKIGTVLWAFSDLINKPLGW